MRRSIRATLKGAAVAAAATVGVCLAPMSASAAPMQDAQAVTLHAIPEAAPTAAAEGKFYDDYWNRNDCISTGDWLVRTGQYGWYVCEEDWLSGDWNLWVYN